MTESLIKPALAFIGQTGQRVGADRIRLLSAIAQAGSISAAARDVGMSYKSAWDAVNAMNNLFPVPLVSASPGGRHGGGARVTDAGRATLKAHERFTGALARAMSELETSLASASTAVDNRNPHQLLGSLTMKSSARNQFLGAITHIESGGVNAEIGLEITPSLHLTAIITHRSAQELGIHRGRTLYALIKASAPILVLDRGDCHYSARNRLLGTVTSVESGPVSTEVVLDLGGGKTLTSIVTHPSANELGIVPGMPLTALIKASQIILMSTD